MTFCALVYRIRCKLWFCFLSIWSKHWFPKLVCPQNWKDWILRACLSHWELTGVYMSNNIFFHFLFIDMHMFSLTHLSSCLDIVGALLKSHYWNMSILYFFDCFFRQWRRHPGGSRIWWWCKVRETRAACCGDWRLGWAR